MPAENFDPQAGFVVVTADDFAAFNEQTFAKFYQPILGPVAFSLFYALKAQLIEKPTLSDRRLQSGLLVQVNAGPAEVAEGLRRLEGVGIIQTYFRNDAEGDVYVYELHATLTPAQFIADDLLSVLLLEAVGVTDFEHLTAKARQYQLVEQDPKLKNISRQFLDEYQIDQHEMVDTPQAIAKARQQDTSRLPAREAAADTTDFDWSTLLQLLDNQPVVKADLAEHRDLIITEHRLYGIDEPTMKRLIDKATNLQDNHFNAQKFKRVVASFYKTTVKQPEQSAPVQTDNHDFTAKDQQLLTSASSYPPIEFLQLIKEQMGGYVTGSERNILRRLVSDGQLPSEVVNILTWYVLADLNYATLRASFVDAIANAWLRAGVKDAAGALNQLKNFNHDKAAASTGKPAAKKGRKYQHVQVRETMPKWSKHDKKASPEAIAKARARLKKNK